MRTRTHAPALAAAALLSLSTPLTILPAQAAEIPDAITDLDITGEARIGDPLTVEAHWRIPDNITPRPGDTFTLPLPPEFTALQTSFPLQNAAGQTIANASVIDGQVVVTLTDYVAANPLNVGGTLRFNLEINETATPGEPITLTWGGTSITLTPTAGWDGVPNTTNFSKWGTTLNGQQAWGWDLPGGQTNLVITDTPEDHSLICDSIKLDIADITPEGTFTNWRAGTFNTTCGPDGGLTVQITDIPAGSQGFLYALVDTTLPTDTNHNGTLENTWTATADGGLTQGGRARYTNISAGGTGDGTAPQPTPEPEPSPEPTEDPSEQPTEQPTPEPTEQPSEQPTPEPTQEPTEQPTEEPTEQPTEEPTEQPTEQPTPEPTEQPKPEPTEQPTPEPTEQPTPEPTQEPTEQPTEQPTPEPTEQPKPEPTEEPKPEPTEEPNPEPEPTEQPSEQPSPEPTQEPSEQPTPEPTEQPTPEPTEEPNPEPEPTEQPSEQPSPEPTQEPSEQPTPEPTEQPSEESSPGTGVESGNSPLPARELTTGTPLAGAGQEPTTIKEVHTHDGTTTITTESGQTIEVPADQQVEQLPTGGADLGTLAHTGAPTRQLLIATGVLVALGTALILTARRKH